MKIYNEQLTLQTNAKREFVNVTPQIKAAMEKSGFRDGIILVSVLHSNAAIIVNEDEPGFLEGFAVLARSNRAGARRIQASRTLREQFGRPFSKPAAAPSSHSLFF